MPSRASADASLTQRSRSCAYRAVNYGHLFGECSGIAKRGPFHLVPVMANAISNRLSNVSPLSIYQPPKIH
jgi:hypothetical protein